MILYAAIVLNEYRIIVIFVVFFFVRDVSLGIIKYAGSDFISSHCSELNELYYYLVFLCYYSILTAACYYNCMSEINLRPS